MSGGSTCTGPEFSGPGGNRNACKIRALPMACVLILNALQMVPFNLLICNLLPGHCALPDSAAGPVLLALAVPLIFKSPSARNRFIKTPNTEDRRFTFSLFVLWIFLSAGIAGAGFFYYQNYEKQYQLGVNSYIQKPVDFDKFLDCVQDGTILAFDQYDA
ncbi:MAG: hypothetical protein JXR49_13480 [Acidobacteria bacterium]|nr:hypothetical protein [Acidobacteriota bacterium]